MEIRTWRERVFQTLMFEVIGVIAFTPLVAFGMGEDAGHSMGLLIALSLAAVSVAGVFNHAFDWIENKKTGRIASERSTKWRVIHAVLLECVIATATLPIIKISMGISWYEAVIADIALLLLYAAYGYLFHMVYDRWRPVARTKGQAATEDASVQRDEFISGRDEQADQGSAMALAD